MRPTILLAVLVSSFAVGCGGDSSPTAPETPATGLTPGERTINVTGGGLSGSYLLKVPTGYTGRAAVPLVIDLHGNEGRSDVQAGMSGFRAKADERGFLVAWPQTPNFSWNAYNCCGDSFSRGSDDVAFIRAVVADIRAKAQVDGSRIYITGLSNGGLMTHRLACEAADLFAAAAAVSAPLNAPRCASGPSRPITVVTFQGYFDPIVPYLGNQFFQSAAAGFSTWLSTNSCAGSLNTQRYGSIDRCDTGTGCAGGVAPALCSLSGAHFLYTDQSTLRIADYAWDVFSRSTR